VIIPRSFIAELIPGAIEPYVGPASRCETALDMCTGSGCLAILMAHAYADADIDAVDISSDALAVAQRNVSDYNLAARINLIRSDLFENLPEKSYDLVICNPPYVDAMAMETLPDEYRREPELALSGGEDGLDAVRVLVKEAPRFLNHGGHLVVEIGQNRTAAETAFPRLPMTWLSTAASDDGVFIVTREELVNGR
jgi:ribosomal protein L3 glutamine methyltransferase